MTAKIIQVEPGDHYFLKTRNQITHFKDCPPVVIFENNDLAIASISSDEGDDQMVFPFLPIRQ